MAQPKPQPVNILRGHRSQIHTAAFIRNNDRLATGDADGYVVLWDLATMRPKTAWRAHTGSILRIVEWGQDRLITHGRDHRLVVWKLAREDEERLSSVAPIELSGAEPPQPWVMHILEVNTMNFCAFAACQSSTSEDDYIPSLNAADAILVAVPNTLASEAIDIYQLPSQTRLHTLKPEGKNGMAMCLSIFHKNGALLLATAFENGLLSVYQHRAEAQPWESIYHSQAHSQPVLSIAADPRCDYLFTSAADATIAKHAVMPVLKQGALGASMQDPIKSVNTKHAGQQSLTIRSDGKIFATAGWDANIRVYSAKSLKELAVLQWHQVGVYAVAFAAVHDTEEDGGKEVKKNEPDDADAASTHSLAVIPTAEKRGTAVADRRVRRAKATHWLAAGAKDGKLSLWSIY